MKLNRFLLIIISAGLLAGGMSCACKKDVKRLGLNDLTRPQLEKSIRSGVDYLRKVIEYNGQFTYMVDVDPERKMRRKYNMLRHAGSIYSLATYASKTSDDTLSSDIAKTVAFLKKAAIAKVAGKDNMLAVWSRPEISGSKKPVQAKLGGSGLTLIALASYEKVRPGTTDIEYMRKIARFVLYMQKKDGSFYSKYIPSKGGRDDSWTSLYYPGEAALGLMMLYELDPSPQWLNGALNAVGYLSRLRKGKPFVEPDHWALLATAKILPHYNKSSKSISRKAVIEHAEQICRTMINSYRRQPEKSLLYGCLTNDFRTTPTATRVEGLLAALTFLPEENRQLRDRITADVKASLVFLMRAQLKEGIWKGGIPREILLLPGEEDTHKRRKDKRRTEIRIDYVQHAISAMMQYMDLFYK